MAQEGSALFTYPQPTKFPIGIPNVSRYFWFIRAAGEVSAK
jgi:hypothetical protein